MYYKGLRHHGGFKALLLNLRSQRYPAYQMFTLQ
ncbi:hypothetical protein T11_15327 [Trichinella zimbabwensis]|uniref:Uncharacterized protein n=1 Tax=Trichinella zimbabwensis TaxID=268475 RepID=A0A0V1EJF3_9BILA|nr:hypothetical protein T11_15327 [Trichinella zimbabwensis]